MAKTVTGTIVVDLSGMQCGCSASAPVVSASTTTNHASISKTSVTTFNWSAKTNHDPTFTFRAQCTDRSGDVGPSPGEVIGVVQIDLENNGTINGVTGGVLGQQCSSSGD